MFSGIKIPALVLAIGFSSLSLACPGGVCPGQSHYGMPADQAYQSAANRNYSPCGSGGCGQQSSSAAHEVGHSSRCGPGGCPGKNGSGGAGGGGAGDDSPCGPNGCGGQGGGGGGCGPGGCGADSENFSGLFQQFGYTPLTGRPGQDYRVDAVDHQPVPLDKNGAKAVGYRFVQKKGEEKSHLEWIYQDDVGKDGKLLPEDKRGQNGSDAETSPIPPGEDADKKEDQNRTKIQEDKKEESSDDSSEPMPDPNPALHEQTSEPSAE